MEKIKTINLCILDTKEVYSRDSAGIEDNGNLLLEGHDMGSTAQAFWGDDEYEFWYTIAQDWKDSILLLLLKERFADIKSITSWLDEKTIPHKFENWV